MFGLEKRRPNQQPQEQTYVSIADKIAAARHSELKTPGRGMWHALCAVCNFIGAMLTFIRNLLANLIMLVLIALVVIGYYACRDLQQEVMSLATTGYHPQVGTADARILYLPLKGHISERPFSHSRFDVLYREFNTSLGGEGQHELLAIERALELACTDDQIEKILIDLQGTRGLSLSQIERLAVLLDRLRTQHKEVITTAFVYTQTNYALASHASTILLDPSGEVSLRGIGFNNLYYKGLLDNLMIRPYIFRAGQFKSAVEPFMLDGMSGQVKEEFADLAGKLWQVYIRSLRQREGLSAQEVLPEASDYVKALASHGGDLARLQLQNHLVDRLQSTADYLAELRAEYGAAPGEAAFLPNMVHYTDYLQQHRAPHPASQNIYVVYATGTITDTGNTNHDFSPDNLLPLLEDIAQDQKARAVVVYINSPGGTVSASELIRRKLLELRSRNIDVIVSMNGTATSGAYMVASAARRILATPSTITGSIGVFGIGLGADQLLNTMGISQDGVVTHELARVPIASPLSQNVMEMLELQIQNIYQRFIGQVATGRGLRTEDYQHFAEGRIFLAQDAQRLKLIDGIGTLQDAIALAARDNHLDNTYRVIHATPQPEHKLPLLERIMLAGTASLLPSSLSNIIATLLLRPSWPNDQTSAHYMVLAIAPLQISKLNP